MAGNVYYRALGTNMDNKILGNITFKLICDVYDHLSFLNTLYRDNKTIMENIPKIKTLLADIADSTYKQDKAIEPKTFYDDH